MDVLLGRESGEKHRLDVPGLNYPVDLPLVRVPGPGGRMLRIASLNLVGQVRLNADLGRLLAGRIRADHPDLAGLAVLTVVEKALQLAQMVCVELDLPACAVAYNRVKPHMEPDRRPVVQVGADSITSGGKFLALYERDLSLLAAARGLIVVDDVVSTGGTLLGLLDLVETAARRQGFAPPPVLGVYCAAQEGERHPLLPVPVCALATLPKPVPEAAA